MSNKRSSDTLDVELCSLPATKRYISEFMSTRFAALSLRRDVLKEVVADRSKFDALSSNKTAQIIEESQQDVTGLDIESLQKVTFKNLSFGLQSAFPEVLNIAPSTFLSSTKLKGLTRVHSLLLYRPPHWLPPIQEYEDEENDPPSVSSSASSSDEAEKVNLISSEMMEI